MTFCLQAIHLPSHDCIFTRQFSLDIDSLMTAIQASLTTFSGISFRKIFLCLITITYGGLIDVITFYLTLNAIGVDLSYSLNQVYKQMQKYYQ